MRLGAKCLERDPAWRELVTPRRLNVAAEEAIAETKAVCQIEDDLDVRPCLSARRDHALPKLDIRLRRLAHLEADTERLGFEGARDGKDDVGKLGGGAHEEIGMDHEVDGLERIACTGASATLSAHVAATRAPALPPKRFKLRTLPAADCVAPCA